MCHHQAGPCMDKRLFFLLNMAQKKLFRHVDGVVERELDASVTQLAALMMICQQPGCLQKDLAQALELNKSAVTGLVTRMEKNGLLQRGSTGDARAVSLFPTESGVAKTHQLKPLIQQLNDRFAEEFSDAEIEVVLRFLNFILHTF